MTSFADNRNEAKLFVFLLLSDVDPVPAILGYLFPVKSIHHYKLLHQCVTLSVQTLDHFCSTANEAWPLPFLSLVGRSAHRLHDLHCFWTKCLDGTILSV